MNSCSDPYQILMVRPGATDGEIRSAFRALIAQWHPDRAASAEAHHRSAAIIQAYRTLSNPDRRSQIDRRQTTAPPSMGHDRRVGERRRLLPVGSGLPQLWRTAVLAWVLVATALVMATLASEWRIQHADDIAGLLS